MLYKLLLFLQAQAELVRGGGVIYNFTMFIHKYNNITSLENILSAWEHFIRGKRNKKDVIIFQSKLSDNITELYYLLQTKTYSHSEYSAFNISDPKPRNIHKAIVRDRLLHHLIYKELYPYFDKRFIFDSYSCRENKGTRRALNRFKYFAGKVSKNNTRTCYILKCDIKKFFANINHNILYTILKRHIEDEEIQWLIRQIVSSFHTTDIGVGLPLVNLTSQLLVNVYMHEFDMFVKQKLLVKHYIRYADDFVILSENKEYLQNILEEIKKFLKNNLKLDLHPNKVFIKTITAGIDFLGWVHFPNHRVLRTTTKRRMLKRINKNSKPETIASYMGLPSHGNTFKIKKYIRKSCNFVSFMLR